MSGQTVILEGPRSRYIAHQLIDAAPLDAVVTVKAPSRTTDQNAKLWAMISDVSRSKPGGRVMTPDAWKAVFMNACGHEVMVIEGLSGEPFPAGFRSSRLSKEQMSELIEFIMAWGTENGVRWTDEAAA